MQTGGGQRYSSREEPPPKNPDRCAGFNRSRRKPSHERRREEMKINTGSERKPRSKIEILMLTSAIALTTLTQYFFAFINPALGILSALASVTALYLALSLLSGRLNQALRESIEIICLIQIYTLLISSLPWFFVSQDLLIPATYSILLALCIWHIKDSSMALAEMGFRKAGLKHIFIGALSGIPLGAAEYYILRPPPPTPTFSIAHFLQTALYMFIFVGFCEELLFRGMLMTSLEKYMGGKPALILQSLIFAILHLTWRIPIEVAFVFAAGIISGLLFKRGRSLIPPTVAHGVGNIILLSVFPFLT
ncbi:MAG: CPBP family intramembrane glutamic endopeptidase [Candidatus Bathyarchaeia archaeon]